jgi:glutathione synthase/RimK-type ligase-like ATP-grasp enzyme
MWHHSHGSPKDILVARQILSALEHTGFIVFPDFRTAWHFDDKVAQKYLFERLDAPTPKAYVFFDKREALAWTATTTFPKVFKLRGGAGSANVRLASTRKQAVSLIRRAFTRGFPNYDSLGNLKERWRKYRMGKTTLADVLKGLVRLIYAPPFAKVMGREVGYAYFQDFIPDNDFDIRVILIDEKAFALKRFVRQGDFRASGSGVFSYAREDFDERCVQIAFDLTARIESQSAVYDFVFDANGNPLVVELSYGFLAEGYDACPGYWDKNLEWHEGPFNPQGWMVDLVVKKIK